MLTKEVLIENFPVDTSSDLFQKMANGVEEVTITTSKSNGHSQKWLVIFFKGKHMNK